MPDYETTATVTIPAGWIAVPLEQYRRDLLNLGVKDEIEGQLYETLDENHSLRKENKGLTARLRSYIEFINSNKYYSEEFGKFMLDWVAKEEKINAPAESF